jgi:hypothetical protein
MPGRTPAGCWGTWPTAHPDLPRGPQVQALRQVVAQNYY